MGILARCYQLIARACSTAFRMERTRLKSSAQPKFRTSNPGTRALVSRMSSALMTRVNNPRVNRVRGSVKRIRTGLMKVLRIPSTRAVTRAAKKPETVDSREQIGGEDDCERRDQPVDEKSHFSCLRRPTSSGRFPATAKSTMVRLHGLICTIPTLLTALQAI